jgi:hypothetical protein
MPAVRPLAIALAVASLAFLFAGPAAANERHFTYTYESAVLPAGGKELEVWSTARIGREDYFVRFDERLEFEVGLTDALQTAFYLNWTAVTADVAPDTRESVTEFTGVSSEWKLKLMDPVADAVGLGLYGELAGGTDEAEIEGKLIIDKQVGDLLVAGNLVLANEWELEPEETETEQEVELVLAGAYFLRPGLSAGLELRNHNEIVEGEWEHSALFLGPVVGYATDDWWATITLLPQLPALKKEGDGSRVLDEHEKLEARLLFSFHLD